MNSSNFVILILYSGIAIIGSEFSEDEVSQHTKHSKVFPHTTQQDEVAFSKQ
jgi:hypothetical protein